MLKVGITGGIGSGKSSVCEVWRSLGVQVINADDLAKAIMVNNSTVREALVDSFGEQAYHSDGSLNRSFLARQAFEKGRVQELNAIVHPHIPARIEELMRNAEREGLPLTVYEAALLLQNGRPDYLDSIVLVLADKEQRLEWVQQRDETSAELVLNRINKQQDFSKLSPLADVVLENNGTLEELNQKAETLHHKFLQEA